MEALGFTAATQPKPGITGAKADMIIVDDAETAPVGNGVENAPARKRGEPSPGKACRTKAEIAEDEAADKADGLAQSGQSEAAPADDAGTQAQDQADEQAEVEQNRDEEKPLTVDDVKKLATAYANNYGMPAAQEDGPKIFVEALGNPPEGEPFWKFSLVPTDQAALQKLASIWKRALDENPLKRAKVA